MLRATVLPLFAAALLLTPSAHGQPPPIANPAFPLGGAIYELDKNHSLLDFTARHLGFGRVRGTFNEYRAAVFFTPDDLTQSAFRAVIDVASLDTQNPGRDDLLREEFFAMAEYPTLTFTSRSIRPRGVHYVMTGDLQIRDVTREVAIPFEVITLDGQDQWHNQRIALEGHVTINRNDYNLVYDNAFWNGIVSDSIRIDISFGAARYNALNDVFPWRAESIATILRDGIEHDGVEATLARVRQLYPADPDDWNLSYGQFFRAGWAFYQQARFDEAQAVFELGLDLFAEASDTERADLHLALAEVALARDDQQAARGHIDQALAIDPLHPAAFLLDRRVR